VAYLRVQTGIFDPSLIGDKAKWYCRYLTPVQFKTYEDKTTLAAAIQFYNQENAKAAQNLDNSLTGKSENPILTNWTLFFFSLAIQEKRIL